MAAMEKAAGKMAARMEMVAATGKIIHHRQLQIRRLRAMI